MPNVGNPYSIRKTAGSGRAFGRSYIVIDRGFFCDLQIHKEKQAVHAAGKSDRMGFPASRTGWFSLFLSPSHHRRRHVQLFGLHRIQPGQPPVRRTFQLPEDVLRRLLSSSTAQQCRLCIVVHTAHPDSCSVFCFHTEPCGFWKKVFSNLFFSSLYFINGIYRRCLETDLQPHRRSLESPAVSYTHLCCTS